MTHTTDPLSPSTTGCLYLLLIIGALIWIFCQPELRQGNDERN